MITTKDLIENSIKAFNNNLLRIENTFVSVSENQLNWKPDAENWSIGECINHLTITNAKYFHNMDNVTIKSKVITKDDYSYEQSFTGKLLTKAVDPLNVKKIKTFKVFNPTLSSIPSSIVDEYKLTARKLIELINLLKGVNLKKTKFSSPVNKLIRMNLGDPLIFIPRHDERHLNQAEQIMKHKEFPKE
jgi:hypothetical protein